MALSDEQRVRRRQYVGSSDAAAILGVDPFKDAYAVWLDKTGQLEPDAGSAATERGRLLESAVLDWASEQLPHGIALRDSMVVSGDLCANLDGLHYADAAATPEIVEAKTSSDPAQCGEPGIAQVHHAMYVVSRQFEVECRVAWVPVLLPDRFAGFDFRMYRVERDDEIAAAVAERGTAFMRDHVRPRVPPPRDALPPLDLLKRLVRVPNKVVPVGEEAVRRYLEACEIARHAKRAKEQCEAALLDALGDAEGGVVEAVPGVSVEYLPVERRAYSVPACTYRSLRVKGGKLLGVNAKGAITDE
jgi:predicted phage-related endonuclease